MSETDIINIERQRAAEAMTKHLETLGATVTVQHFTGDSSFPTEHTIEFHGVSGMGPIFEIALMNWLTALINRTYNLVSSYQSIDTAIQLLTANMINMRTELLIVKSIVSQEKDE